MTMIYDLPDDLSVTSKPSEEWLEFLEKTPLPGDLNGPDIVAVRNERNRLINKYLASNPAYLAETTVEVTDTTYPTTHTPLPARIYTPSTPSLGTLLWFHGGGFAVGNHLADDETLRHICHHSSIIIISASYRLSPEHTFPSAPTDAWSAALWASSLAGDSPLYTGGISAGGNLACVVARRARDTPEAGVVFQGQLLAFPWTCSHRAHNGRVASFSQFEAYVENKDAPLLSKDNIEMLERLVGSPEATDADFSPLWDEKEGKGLPRAVIFAAGLDPLRDDGVAYWKMLERAGGVGTRLRIYHGLPHAFHRFKQMKTAREFKINVNEGIKELMALQSQTSKI